MLPLAANGVEALRAINDEEPEVAFLDIRMPGLTGLELAGRIDTNTHVVFVTAFDQYAVEAFDRDAVDYVLKPVTDERLAQVHRAAEAQAAGRRDARPRWTRCSRGSRARCPEPRRGGCAGCARSRARWCSRSRWTTCSISRPPTSTPACHRARASRSSACRSPSSPRSSTPSVFWQIHRSTLVNMNAVASTRRDLGGRVFVRLKDGKTELAGEPRVLRISSSRCNGTIFVSCPRPSASR